MYEALNRGEALERRHVSAINARGDGNSREDIYIYIYSDHCVALVLVVSGQERVR